VTSDLNVFLKRKKEKLAMSLEECRTPLKMIDLPQSNGKLQIESMLLLCLSS